MPLFGRRNDGSSYPEISDDRVQLVGEEGEDDGTRPTLAHRFGSCIRGNKRCLLFLLALILIFVGNVIAIYFAHFRYIKLTFNSSLFYSVGI